MNSSVRRILVFAALIAVGAIGRLVFLAIPNFSPAAAVAIFAGFYFAKRRTAILVPLGAMLISNLWLNSYRTWSEMAVVYGAFIFPVLLSHSLRRMKAGRPSLTAMRLATCAVLPSMFFFVTTNFAVWVFSGFYAHTLAGLATCYVQAIPFYGYTLAGDLIFSAALFGAYYASAIKIGRPATRPIVAIKLRVM